MMGSLKSSLARVGIGGGTRSNVMTRPRSDIYIIDCSEQIGGHRAEDPLVLAKGMASMIENGDGFVTVGNIILATVEHVERLDCVVRVYVTPLDGIERGTTN